MNNDRPYHDSLNFHFGWLPMGANFNAVESGYELMLSQGVNIIQNDSLRNNISFLYSSNYSWLTSWLKDRQYLDTPYVLDEMIKTFSEVRVYESAIPRNYESLKSNESFKAAISHHLFCYELTDRFYQRIIDYVKDLVKDIDLEILRLN